MKNKKNIIVISIALVILILGAILIYYGLNKKSSLITKDTLFLCKDNSNNDLELVKASDNKREKDVCGGKSYKYVCQTKDCGGEKNVGQFFQGYLNSKLGIALIGDTEDRQLYFLYDFKNGKKLSDEYMFPMILYNNLENNKTYFLVKDKAKEKYAVIDNYGKLVIDFSYDEVGFNLQILENNSRDILLANKGIIFLRLKDKLGIYDLEQEKLITKMNLDKIGYYIYDGEYVKSLLSELFSQVDNYNLNQIYVEENKVGKIINYKTGETIKTLNKTYDFVLLLSDELILVSENNATDILDNNFKSVLKEKIKGTANYNWDYDGGFDLEKDDFKNIIIRTNDKDYIFNIEKRVLSENQVITKDTLFLCPSGDKDGVMKKVLASDKLDVSNVCNGGYKYECQLDYCNSSIGAQFFDSYYSYSKGIGIIYEGETIENAKKFLYDFKNQKVLIKDYNLNQIIYEDKDKTYFLATDKNDKVGIVDSTNKKVTEFKYDYFMYCPGCASESRDYNIINNGVLIATINKKYGFIDIKTGKELTNFEYEQYGYYKYNGQYNSNINDIYGENYKPSEIENRKLHEIYVTTSNSGLIINYMTGKVVRTLDKKYNFALSLNEKLVLVEDNKTIDILDENNKSVLKEKIKFNNLVYLNWDNDKDNFTNYDYKNFKITFSKDNSSDMNDKAYIFNVDERTLSEK